MKIRFFKAPGFPQMARAHHGTARELWVGFYKKTSGQPSITWPESVNERFALAGSTGFARALTRSAIRSASAPASRPASGAQVNMKLAQELLERGIDEARGHQGIRAAEGEQVRNLFVRATERQLPDPYAKTLRENKAAWDFFQAQTASYRRATGWWVVSARRKRRGSSGSPRSSSARRKGYPSLNG